MFFESESYSMNRAAPEFPILAPLGIGISLLVGSTATAKEFWTAKGDTPPYVVLKLHRRNSTD